MSRALAVFHGHFGRATVYQLNRPFNVHAHREGHLIFHVGGTPGCIEVLERDLAARRGYRRRRQSLGAAQFPAQRSRRRGAVFRSLRQRRSGLRPRAASRRLAFRLHAVHGAPPRWTGMIRQAAAMVCGAPSLNGLDGELRNLIDACHEESWRQAEAARRSAAPRRHRFSRPQVDPADAGGRRRRDRAR